MQTATFLKFPQDIFSLPPPFKKTTTFIMGKRQSKLKSGALEDLRSVTQLGDAEIIELHKDFLKDCPSGLVRVEMFMTLYRKLFHHGVSFLL